MASQQMEAQKAVMEKMLGQGLMPRFDGDIDARALREVVQGAQSRMALEPGVTFVPEKFGDMDAELSVPENARDDGIIVYVHGGGLICGNAETSRGYASMLAGETKLPVYAFSYRLAPENPYPAAVDDCFLAYRETLARYPDKPIFLIGESGGAYLSIVTALRARDSGLKIPAGIIPYSPPIDMSGAIDRDRPGNKDFTVSPAGMAALARLYCSKGTDLKDPYISPYYADLTGMPPMLLAWDESESLAPDSELLRDKARSAGVEVQAKSYPDCFHAFATAGRGTPESAEVLADTVAFIFQHCVPAGAQQ